MIVDHPHPSIWLNSFLGHASSAAPAFIVNMHGRPRNTDLLRFYYEMLVVYTSVQFGIPCHRLLLCNTNRGWSKNSGHTLVYIYLVIHDCRILLWKKCSQKFGNYVSYFQNWTTLANLTSMYHVYHFRFPALTRVYSDELASSCTTKSFVTESVLPSMCGNPSEHSMTHHKITLAKTPELHRITLAQTCSYHRHRRSLAAQITRLFGNNMAVLCFC